MQGPDWTFHNPVRIDAGPGALTRVARHVPQEGSVLLVTTAGFVRRGVAQRLIDTLGAARVRLFAEVTPNPGLDELDDAVAAFAGQRFAAVVALGGGSVMDAAKALSVGLCCGFERPFDRVLRRASGHQWAERLPVVAIPTTSGTGAEVTPFATVWDHAARKKHSVTGELVFPQAAVLDPELTLSLPPEETLYTALDAISHARESLWKRRRTALSGAFATQALRLSIEALPDVLARPDDLAARTRMQQASVLAGLAISQTRTAIAHSISYPLTSHHGVPHGLACSFTLTNVISVYLEQNPGSPFAELMDRTGRLLERLDLFGLVGRYASNEQIGALRGEMLTPGRSDNFDGQIDDLAGLIVHRPRHVAEGGGLSARPRR